MVMGLWYFWLPTLNEMIIIIIHITWKSCCSLRLSQNEKQNTTNKTKRKQTKLMFECSDDDMCACFEWKSVECWKLWYECRTMKIHLFILICACVFCSSFHLRLVYLQQINLLKEVECSDFFLPYWIHSIPDTARTCILMYVMCVYNPTTPKYQTIVRAREDQCYACLIHTAKKSQFSANLDDVQKEKNLIRLDEMPSA